MIITRLRGGLGNQMFSYAFSRYLAIKNNEKLFLDFTYLTAKKISHNEIKELNISGKTLYLSLRFPLLMRIFFKILKILSKKLKKRGLYYKERRRCYFKKNLLNKKVFVLDGYWTCESYFKDIKDVIKKDFTLKEELNKENKSMLKKIINSNSICIHIRRGDRVTNSKFARIQAPCSLDYYNNSIKLITKKIKKPHFFAFSDDPIWVKKNLKTNFPITYVDINKDPKGGARDFNLMKYCKHFIIARSTVSWWAAWLSENKNKTIIAPKKLFNNRRKEGDIIPKNWIRVKD